MGEAPESHHISKLEVVYFTLVANFVTAGYFMHITQLPLGNKLLLEMKSNFLNKSKVFCDVICTADHMVRFTRPLLIISVHCKSSNNADRKGLGMRVQFSVRLV